MLTLENLTCFYQQQPMRFSLSVSAGEKVVILGASGAGKSTLLNLIAGFIPAAEGKMWLDGQLISQQPPAKRPLSMLFQEYNLFTHLSVKQNLALGLSPHMRLTAEQHEKMLWLAQRTGLTDLLHRLPSQLSGGQRQRVALTRCLLRERPLLLLDEPFSALDPRLRQEMLHLTDELCRENQLTLLIVSHQLEDARQIADRCLLIEQGMISWQGPTAALMAGEVPAAISLGIKAANYQ